MSTTIVAPLLIQEIVAPNKAVAIDVEFQGQHYTLDTALMANIELRALGAVQGNVSREDLAIHQAINKLFVGF